MGDRQHSADEFSRTTGSTSITGLDAPTIGAAGMILVDGITEDELGATPPPPPISVRQIAVAVGVLFVIGVLLLSMLMLRRPVDAGGPRANPGIEHPAGEQGP